MPDAMTHSADAASPLMLAPILDLNAAAPLRADLLARQGQPIVLDASQVQRLGGLSLQVLLAARAAWSVDGHDFTLSNPSPAFLEAVGLFGASASLAHHISEPAS